MAYILHGGKGGLDSGYGLGLDLSVLVPILSARCLTIKLQAESSTKVQ